MPPRLYGETDVMEIVAQFRSLTGGIYGVDGQQGPESWPTGLLTDAGQFGRAVGLRRLLRERSGHSLEVVLAAPVFPIEAGQMITIPQAAFRAVGWDRIIASQLDAATFVVSGYEWEVGMQGDNELTVGSPKLYLEEV